MSKEILQSKPVDDGTNHEAKAAYTGPHGNIVELILGRLQYIVDGNGGNPENIVAVGTPQYTCYKFPAHTFIRLSSKVSMRHEYGKNTDYQSVDSQEEFRHKTQDVVRIIAEHDVRRQQVIDIVLARPDRGFGLSGKTIQLKGFTQNIVWHEPCEECHHTGKMTCPRCDGRARELCATCHGSRQSNCLRCGGIGRIQSPRGQDPCPQCNHTGRIACTTCGGQGQIACRGCGGSSKTTCGACHGRGHNSHIAHIEVEAALESKFDPESMPPILSHMISHKSQELFANRELFFCDAPTKPFPQLLKSPLFLNNTGENHSTNKDDDEETERLARSYAGGVIPLDFYIGAYFGIFEFSVDGESIPVTVIGEGARPISSSHFLERLALKGIKALKRAAHGSIEPVADVKRACGFKILRQVMTEAVLAKPSRIIASHIHKEYPIGISSKTLMELANSAITVLRHVTRMPRYLGMLVGQSFLGLFCSYYYFHGGQKLLAYFSNDIAKYFSLNLSPDMYLTILYLANAVIIYLGYVGAKYLGRVWGRRAQKKIVECILTDINNQNSESKGFSAQDLAELPAAGIMGWWSLILSVLIVAACLFLKA